MCDVCVPLLPRYKTRSLNVCDWWKNAKIKIIDYDLRTDWRYKCIKFSVVLKLSCQQKNNDAFDISEKPIIILYAEKLVFLMRGGELLLHIELNLFKNFWS